MCAKYYDFYSIGLGFIKKKIALVKVGTFA